jgi:hypothetical protein
MCLKLKQRPKELGSSWPPNKKWELFDLAPTPSKQGTHAQQDFAGSHYYPEDSSHGLRADLIWFVVLAT